MEYLENRTFDEINIGDSATLTRALTEKDIKVFAIMSGDINPAHVDVEYAESEMFHEIIGHGMWGAALISTVLGTQLPGPGTIYVSQTLRFKKPVAIGDTLRVKVTAVEKKAQKKRVLFACDCQNQKDQIVIEGQAEVIAPTKKIRRKKTELPEISLRRAYKLFDKYIDKAKNFDALRAAVIYPIHPKIIAAVNDAYATGLIDPILIGPKDRILHAACEAQISVDAFEMIEVENSFAAINKAIVLAREDAVGVIIRGGAIREDLLRIMQNHDKGLITERSMSAVLVLDVPTYPKALILTDTMINVDPHLDVKRSITQNAIDFALSLGIETPKVAILAGVDIISNDMSSTLDAAALCKMAERGQIRGGILDGPLTFDDVISVDAAKEQGISSTVAGDADILVVPNVETGTILAKQLEYLAESRNASLVLGGRVPILMSHINDIHLSTASCAFAILVSNYLLQKTEKIF